jgi:hypothetical protein
MVPGAKVRQFQLLDHITEPDQYLLLRMDDLATCLSDCIIFSTLDLKQEYYQLPICAANRKKMTIITSFSLFKYMWMPFG